MMGWLLTVDVVDNPLTIADEIHNCQAVIDSLATDILNTSLSHITGHDIISGDLTAIGNLLELFSGLMEYMLEEISSMASSNSVPLSTGSLLLLPPLLFGSVPIAGYEFKAGLETDFYHSPELSCIPSFKSISQSVY